MSAEVSSGGSEDVADFLRRIKELNEQRDREDGERTRKLEEEIMEGRRQREARRAERARSLSPEKQDSISRPQTPRSTRLANQPDVSSSPSIPANKLNLAVREQEKENIVDPTRDHTVTPTQVSSTIETLPKRGGTLSWQQRPSSPFGLKTRPTPDIERSASPNIPQTATREAEPTKADISKQLASKDPSWFRQSPRESTALAFRRNRGEDENTSPAPRRALPGLSDRAPKTELNGHITGSRSFDPEETVSQIDPTKRISSPTSSRSIEDGLTSPPPANFSQSPALETENLVGNDLGAITPRSRLATPNPMSPNRAVSPTKGLGGFVQSAMKRSDSVSKKWSVQTPTLSRQGSISAIHDSYNASTALPKMVERATTPRLERTVPSTPNLTNNPKPHIPPKEESPEDSAAAPGHLLQRPREEEHERLSHGEEKHDESNTPSSPSKRWSPVKSSWLESALSRPGSPQPPSSPSQPAQPTWLSELNRSKQNRSSIDHGRANDVPQKRSLAENIKKSPPAKPKPMFFQEKLVDHNNARRSQSINLQSPPSLKSPRSPPALPLATKPVPPSSKPQLDQQGKTDYRPVLRTSSAPSEQPQEEELEFRNAFGRLKHAHTEKSETPNELKDNILRGRRALSPTKQPLPDRRKDELRDSLINQKQSLVPKSASAAPQTPARKPAIFSGDSLPGGDDTKVKTEAISQPSPASFTANLSAVLARGSAPGARSQISTATGGHKASTAPQSEEPSATTLQHITKGRAKGPKRRLPNTNADAPIVQSEGQPPRESKQENGSGRTNEQSPPSRERPILPPRVRSFPPKDGMARSPSLPSRPTKPSGLRSTSGTLIAESPESSIVEAEPNGNPIDLPHILSVKNASAQWGRRAVSQSANGSLPNMPVELPPRTTLKPMISDNSLHRASTVAARPSKRPTIFDMPTTARASGSQTVPGNRVASVSARPKPPPIARKPSGQAIEAARKSSQTNGGSTLPETQSTTPEKAFAEFFRDTSAKSTQIKFDTHAIMSANSGVGDTIKSLRSTISELSSDGKTVPLPRNEDHILFSRCMYICSHIFGSSTGARMTEIYLWAGSSIPDGTLEEGKVIARKTAKECGGTLYVFRQGKESSNFIQAVGGIVITRYGTTQDHKKSYMLCGRRHLGHIAFDEVDLSLANLCSGFPFIVASAASNTIYLWKGKGCHTEELAGARLMSMDLGVSCRVLEVDEGREGNDFLSIFSASSANNRPQAENKWDVKTRHSDYHVRLFRVDEGMQQATTVTALWNRVRQNPQAENAGQASTKVLEITPFCHADVEPENVYVLDAFSEIYILVGPLAQDKYTAFQTALLFAQDYAIVAASAQDRTSVPPGTVLMLEGTLPPHLRPLFRQYGSEENTSTASLMAGRSKSGADSVRTFPLNEAIAACRTS